MWAFVYACCWNIHLTIILQLRVSNICLCTFNLTYLSIFVSLHVYIHWFMHACTRAVWYVLCIVRYPKSFDSNSWTNIASLQSTLYVLKFTVYADMGKPLRHLTDGWVDLLDGTLKFWKMEEVVNLESMVGVARL